VRVHCKCLRRDVLDVLYFVNYPLRRNANDKRCVCRLQIACE
jgi:hypothetical protein